MENEFSQWSKYIEESFKRINQELMSLRESKVDKINCHRHIDVLEDINKEINALKVSIEVAKFKHGLWGAVGASLPVTAMLIFQVIGN